MATVYRARDRELRREVAIKVLFPHLCKNREVVARFQREARAAAALDHPHILRVLDVGGGAAEERESAEPPFIVLELVRGPSLAALAAGGPLLAELAAACGAAVAEALAHAHAAGVIHRDVKPANLLVAEGGRLVLADFGVAHVAEDDSSLVTRTGALLGTPAFMSPEQATGGALDARSDLYSLGATLYQLATGSLPVSGNAARAVAAIVAGEVVPPLRRNPALGRELAGVIERLMAVDPAGRVASAAELAAELRAIAEPVGEPEALLAELFADRAACEARVKPLAVASSVARARKAAEEGNAARALALCDRALALDGACREAVAIVEGIGRRRRLGRAAVAAAIAAVAAGGGIAAWRMAGGGEGREEAAKPIVAAAPVADAAPMAVPVGDAGPPTAEGEEQREKQKQDAGDRGLETGNRDRKKRRREVTVEPPVVPEVVDAAPAKAEPEKPPADARLTVAMDTWCDLTIDREAKGRVANARTVAVRPGRHAIACGNRELGTWQQTVELAPGQALTVKGALLPAFAVAVRLSGGDAVRIGRARVASGASARLKRGHVAVEVLRGGQVVDRGYVDIVRACTLVDRPAIACR